MAIARRLDHTTGLVQALLDEARLGGEPIPAHETARRRHAASSLLEDVEIPAAAFAAVTLAPRLVNARWRELFGEAARALPSAGLPPEATLRFAEVVTTGDAMHVPELQLRTPVGTRYGAATIAPLRDNRGAIEGVIVACLPDVAPEHAALARHADPAELAARTKDQFLATVSHELRAPLTTMLLWESVLRDENSEPELRQHALDAIHQSAILQSRLVADLLDVARAGTGKLFIDLRGIDIRGVLEEAIEAIAPSYATKRVALETRFDLSVGAIEGDALRLRQVFDNLLSNALKFTDAGGRVTVSTHARGAAIAIEIADTGRGITPEFLPHLFEPFSQIEDERTRSEGGLGLGLAIAHELVTLHHGTLAGSSRGPGYGATFTVTLPTATRARSSTPPPRPRSQALDGLRILVVDDDRRVRDALLLLLSRAGAAVETTASAVAAREILAHQTFDVIVSDIAMPGEDGYAFLRSLRAAGIETPAVALTAYATAADAQDARDAGFDLHVSKPVDFELLVTSVHAAIAARGVLGRDTRVP